MAYKYRRLITMTIKPFVPTLYSAADLSAIFADVVSKASKIPFEEIDWRGNSAFTFNIEGQTFRVIVEEIE